MRSLPPPLILALVLSTTLAAIIHLIRGGSGRLLAYRTIAAWLGFALGHFLGQAMGIPLGRIGPLQVLVGGLGAVTLAFLVAIFTKP
ncbi:MAG: hypothetical protein D6759_09150 [Chloroflexi bacterium]|nr:MAG: hypothetical protein D6759_09150 [Chloroflexota bacterium]